MNSLLESLRRGETLVADGAIGSLLIEKGLAPGAPPESVNLVRPELLQEIARTYIDAGAQIIQANTFGASPLRLASHGLEKNAAEINARAVDAVRSAVGADAYVYGSIGPSGRLLKPYGDTDPLEVLESFSFQVRILVERGVDLICVETMLDVAEAVLAVEAIRSVSQTIPVCAAMTFDETPRGFYTVMGVDVPTAVEKLTEAGADVVGSNCGNGIEKMVAIARAYREVTAVPLIIQSNAGLPERQGERLVYPEDPDFMAARVPDLMREGVGIIGGCCGTGPEHIRAIRDAVDAGRRPVKGERTVQ